jgi:hypothetical protein
MLRSICKKTDLGAQYACKRMRITANMLILGIKTGEVLQHHRATEVQECEVQWWKSCSLKIHGKEM